MIGVSIGTSVGGCNVQLSINLHGNAAEYSDWGFSEVVIWNRVLPYAEMKKVSDAMLMSLYGVASYFNSVTNTWITCPVGSNSTGSGCICKEAGYYWNYASNACIACPVGSISTGIGCTCVGNTYFNSVSSTCAAYFSYGVSGDAPWGIWRAQSYVAGSPNVLKESRGNGRDITISGSITINNSSGNGALNSVYSIEGGIGSTMLWPSALSEDFTICSMTRYTGSSNRQRILNQVGGTCDWFHGHGATRRGVALYDNHWRTPGDFSTGAPSDWLVMCGQNSASNSDAAPNNIIADGM
jgi:hypothetical protein